MEAKISVIIPIYNVERYFKQCLDSVVNQTHKNLEIILIDDGSPDQCGMICDEYAKNDSRIKVVHKKNSGLSAAWNDGLTIAIGDWIAFVDSDDWIDSDYFEILLKSSKADNADIIQSSEYYWESEKGRSIRRAFLTPFVFENGSGSEFMITHSLMRPDNKRTKGVLSNVWGKMYRTSFLRDNGLRFDVKIRAGLPTDTLFNVEAYQKASTIVGIIYCGYHYRVTTTSGTFKYDPERIEKEKYVLDRFNQLLDFSSMSVNLQKAFESYYLRDIVHNLERFYFHPENKASYHEITAGIRAMKEISYYKIAINSTNNPYNGINLKFFQVMLKLPWIFPLRIIICIWSIVNNQ